MNIESDVTVDRGLSSISACCTPGATNNNINRVSSLSNSRRSKPVILNCSDGHDDSKSNIKVAAIAKSGVQIT
ncbi:hypothetical protein TcasGA2_TC008609 [Tribolium castaneum]|uniref:Uncharacterized protein n=1 Tax=Tribolium castaneum TaxID=7070 RepID=D6WTM4_TRICA|nr:hypothetical protein TcasGA2_TC008609 [Tribolium castaneum]